MSKINILTSEIYNRIAAGEVVERPASVIKELLENSIDACAKNISINISGGGIDRIRVVDDGCGIEKDDLSKAFLPHATSKITGVNDLENITTLGFRGEALASIAAVAKVRIISSAVEGASGYEIKCDGGMLSEVLDCAANHGTEITVDNLFFNTPARAKFLKTPKTEETEITNIIARLILANPNISFKYTADSKKIYQSYGGGIEESIISVYGKEAVENSFHIETEKHGVVIKGYVGHHDYTKPNRTYQTFILNGRYIINNTVSSAIANAYSPYLMKRNYPFYVLSVSMPNEFVDVNVHPNKTDVRFSNNQLIYGVLYSVISSVLDGSSSAIDIIKSSKDDKNLTVNGESIPKHYSDTKFSFTNPVQNDKIVTNNIKLAQSNPVLTFSDSYNNYFGSKENLNKNLEIPKNQQVEKSASKDYYDNSNESVKSFAKPFDDKKLQTKTVQAQVCAEPDFRCVGQIFKTYVLYEKGDEFILIDQHAAHERLLYDKLKEKLENQVCAAQTMLVPYVLEVNPIEAQFLAQKAEDIRSLGFDFAELGLNKFAVSAVPTVLSEIDLKEFFYYILSDIVSYKREKTSDVLKEKLMQTACKSAIKAGKELSDREKEILISKLKDNMGLKCPHARPIAVKVSRQEIEKWFKRIV